MLKLGVNSATTESDYTFYRNYMHKNDSVIDLVNATLHFRPEGFIHIHYKSHAFTLNDNKEIFEALRSNSPWHYCPFLISTENFSSHDKESNMFNSSIEVMQHCSAYAFIAKNTGQKITADFFIKMYKPHTACKVFTSKTEALIWLEPFITENRLNEERTQ